MKKLLVIQHQDKRADEIINFFFNKCMRWTGTFIAAFGGLDTFIFSRVLEITKNTQQNYKRTSILTH